MRRCTNRGWRMIAEDMTPFYRLVRDTSWAVLRARNRFSTIGAENVPVTGAAIVACNHMSYVDPPALGCRLPRPVTYMAKMELFTIPVLGPAIHALDAFPVDRSRGDVAAIKAAAAVLRAGKLVGIFPEGTRNIAGTVRPQMGVALLASLSGAPVVPAYIHGSQHMLRGAKITVVYGKPERFVPGRKARREDLAKWTGELMERIYALRENVV